MFDNPRPLSLFKQLILRVLRLRGFNLDHRFEGEFKDVSVLLQAAYKRRAPRLS